MRPQWRLLFPELRGSLVLYIKDVSSTISMFLDRFLISLFLGLEMTGVYTLFWSITNVVHSLAVYDIIKAQLPSLIASGRNPDRNEFARMSAGSRSKSAVGRCCWRSARRRHAVAAAVAPSALAQESLPIFWIILVATLLRVAADVYGFVLLALEPRSHHRHHRAGGAVASAVLNVMLTPCSVSSAPPALTR